MAASAHPSIKHPAPCQHPDKSTSSSSPPDGEGGFELRRLGGFLNTIFAHRKEKHHHHHRPVLSFPSSSWKWRFGSFSTLGRPLGKKMTSFGTAQAHLVRRNKRSVDVTQQKKKKNTHLLAKICFTFFTNPCESPCYNRLLQELLAALPPCKSFGQP